MMMKGFYFLKEPGVLLIIGFNATLSLQFARFLSSKEFYGFKVTLYPLKVGVKDLTYLGIHGTSFFCVHGNLIESVGEVYHLNS